MFLTHQLQLDFAEPLLKILVSIIQAGCFGRFRSVPAQMRVPKKATNSTSNVVLSFPHNTLVLHLFGHFYDYLCNYLMHLNIIYKVRRMHYRISAVKARMV